MNISNQTIAICVLFFGIVFSQVCSLDANTDSLIIDISNTNRIIKLDTFTIRNIVGKNNRTMLWNLFIDDLANTFRKDFSINKISVQKGSISIPSNIKISCQGDIKEIRNTDSASLPDIIPSICFMEMDSIYMCIESIFSGKGKSYSSSCYFYIYSINKYWRLNSSIACIDSFSIRTYLSNNKMTWKDAIAKYANKIESNIK